MTTAMTMPHAGLSPASQEAAGVLTSEKAIGAGLVAAVVFFNEAVLRVSNVEQFAFDWQIALRLAICVACGYYGWRFRETWEAYRVLPAALVVGMLGWAALTIVFSVNPRYSLASTAALGCMVMFAPAALATLGGRTLSLAVLSGLLVFLGGGWVAHFLYPELGREEVDLPGMEYRHRMGGLNSPNGTGRQAALALALTAAATVAGSLAWRHAALLGGLAAFTLVATDSRTALLAGLGGTGVVIAERIGRGNTLRLILAVLFVGALVAFFALNGPAQWNSDVFFAKFSRSGDADEIYHMTGRVELWDFVLAKIAESPLLGCGWGCTRFLMIDGHFATHHAHNVILNCTLGGGVVVGALVAASLAWLALRGLTTPNLFPDMVTALICINGVADAGMLNPIPDSHTMLWLIALHWRSMGATLCSDEFISDEELAASSLEGSAEPLPSDAAEDGAAAASNSAELNSTVPDAAAADVGDSGNSGADAASTEGDSP